MDSSRLNRWMTLAANLGVVIGLIVLVFEVRQNAALTRLSLETSKNDLLAAVEFNLTDPVHTEAWIKAYRAPETLTEAEIRAVETHLLALMLQWDYMFQMEFIGMVDIEQVRNHVRNGASIYFGNAFAKAWFEREMQFWRGTRMQEIAGPIVAAVDTDFMRQHYDGLLELAAKSADVEQQE